VAPAARGAARAAADGPPRTLRLSAAAAPVGPVEVLAEDVVRVVVAYSISVERDPELLVGRVVVVRPGAPGIAENVFRVHLVDGAEVERTLVGRREVVPAVGEVRRVGMKAPPAPPEIEAIIRAAAAAWGADPEQMLRVAWCESRYDPAAFNSRDSDSGLFQFIPSTWAANSVRAGHEGASPFDPVASANVAAFMFARGQAWAWVCK
jgi:hypothetical protein